MRLPTLSVRSMLRDLALIGIAVSIGWWGRCADRTVLAQHSSSSSSSRGSSSAGDMNLAFQFIGAGPQSSLAVYNSANRTVYVYPRIGEGGSSVDCSYSFTVVNPGAPIKRENCPVGDLIPH